MFKKIFDTVVQTIKEEYKFIIFLTFLLIILFYPVNYYIITGGGISDVSSRINVSNKNNSKGSFNISYVSELDGTLLFYGLSYIIPTWERESVNDYKYTETENLDDIKFRGELDLKTANTTATYWAYTLANKNIKLVSSDLYVIITNNSEYPSELKVGDIVLSIDGIHYDDVSDYVRYIQEKNVGDILKVNIKRNNREMVVDSPVYENNGSKLIGIVLKYYREYETDPKVSINFRRTESGPSGGLISTLEIYNQLTKEDLTKGKVIAGTGTIEADGTIGQIGGVEHKILGASAAKADVFIMPGGDNYKKAKEYVKSKNLKIKLISVDNIEEAIKKLEELE